MSKWPLPLACLLVTGCYRASDDPATHPLPVVPAEASSQPSTSSSSAESLKPADAVATAADFNRALDEARQVADAETRSVRIAAVFAAWAAADLVESRRSAAALPDGEERLSAHEGVLAAALLLNVREAVAWVLGLQPPALSAVLLDQALADWVRVDARAAGAHVASLDSSDYRTILAGEVARAWVVRDAAAATVWSAGLTDQEAREEALRAALGDLVAREPRRAAELALAVPNEGDRAASLELAVHSWWERDQEAVSTWAAQIGDERLRTQVARLLDARREAADVGAL